MRIHIRPYTSVYGSVTDRSLTQASPRGVEPFDVRESPWQAELSRSGTEEGEDGKEEGQENAHREGTEQDWLDSVLEVIEYGSVYGSAYGSVSDLSFRLLGD